MEFAVDYDEILDSIETISPSKYAKTRNFTDGAVTRLSPYISRGVISTKQIMDSILARGYTIFESKRFIQELAWREYYQRTWQHLKDDIFDDIRINYTGTRHKQLPDSIIKGETGIAAIDKAILELYATGYIHNHLRMYIASLVSNIGKSYWKYPSQWMYYHLLDGDLASNTLSWQWVAGNFSLKQYYFNQENVNKYTYTEQAGTFIDKSYEELMAIDIPERLLKTSLSQLNTVLPKTKEPAIDSTLPLLIYNSYNLDPVWKKEIKANRILLLEPSHFLQYPVSEKVINFILELANNIKGIQLFVGEVSQIPFLQKVPAIYSKEHPAFNHLPGIKEGRDWLFPKVKDMDNSFFSYWKKCEPYLKDNVDSMQKLNRA